MEHNFLKLRPALFFEGTPLRCDIDAEKRQIWRISQSQFEKTKSDTLEDIQNLIFNEFGINWNNVNYAELSTPLYSALAFHLYLNFSNNFSRRFSREFEESLYHEISNHSRSDWQSG